MKYLFLILFALLGVSPAFGQTWSQVGAGFDDAVYTLYADSIVNRLYAGGRFDNSGNTPLNKIGYWDGLQWNPMGAGFNNIVQDIEMYNGEIYAAGSFTLSDTTSVEYIAKWNGITWENVGGGVNAAVKSLYTFNGNLYAGGYFTMAGNQPCKYVATWNGSSWSALDTNIQQIQSYPVQCIGSFQNELVIGGHFLAEGTANNIAMLQNGIWQPLAGGTNSWVSSVREINNELIVTGYFNMVDTIGSMCIAKWNGTNWISVYGPMSSEVMCQEEYNGNLIFGGAANSFLNMGWGQLSPGIANYNPGTQDWSGIDSGFAHYVNALAMLGNTLYSGGAFSLAGNNTALNIAQLNASTLSVAEILGNKIVRVFPNPATTDLKFEFREIILKGEIIITDQLGREIRREEVDGKQYLQIDIADLAEGMFFYQLLTNDKSVISTGKFLVQKWQ